MLWFVHGLFIGILLLHLQSRSLTGFSDWEQRLNWNRLASGAILRVCLGAALLAFAFATNLPSGLAALGGMWIGRWALILRLNGIDDQVPGSNQNDREA